MTSENNDRRLGIVLGLVANSVWGCAALYWVQTRPVAPIDVLAHRALWTLPAVFTVLFLLRRVTVTLRMLRDIKTLLNMALAAALISLNWGVFLYAVTGGKATEASLGYFMLPILSVLMGALFFKERPSRPQQFAIATAVLAIAVQVISLGALPVVSLGLSLSFALYGVIRKKVALDAVQGLFVEALFMLPVGLAWVWWHGGAGLGQHGLKVDALLIGAGAFTAIPLLTHVTAARLLPFSTIGFLAYVGPTLQLLVATLFLGEVVNTGTLVAFAMVWLGLSFIVFDNVRSYHRLRRSAKAANARAL